MTRAEVAREYFKNGYACSQAVALAFQKDVNVDAETLEKITLPFGGGLGRLRLTCGAVSGMAATYGLFIDETGASPELKKKVYAGVRELCARFESANGSLICSDLLALGKRPCAEIVYTATEILETYLIEQGLLEK